MPPKRVPIKGEPNFTFISDEKLKGYIDLIQSLIAVYADISDEKVKMLREMWKEMCNEQTDRFDKEFDKELKRQEEEENQVFKPLPVRKVKPVRLVTKR